MNFKFFTFRSVLGDNFAAIGLQQQNNTKINTELQSYLQKRRMLKLAFKFPKIFLRKNRNLEKMNLIKKL
jgi:hypothetical protein